MRHLAHPDPRHRAGEGAAPRGRQLFQLSVREPSPRSIRAQRTRLPRGRAALPRPLLRIRSLAVLRHAVARARHSASVRGRFRCS